MTTRYRELTDEERTEFAAIIHRSLADDAPAAAVVMALKTSMGKEFGLRLVQRHIKKARAGKPQFEKCGRKPKGSNLGGTIEIEGTGSDTQEVTMYSEKRVVTVEDALKKGGVDPEQWEVDRFVLNSWEVGAKGPDRRVRVTPLWQVKVWLKAKKGWNANEFRALLAADLRKLAPSYHTPRYVHQRQPILAELSICDAHFGKLAWQPETGQDYDLKIAERRYMTAARDLIARASREELERLVFVVGNDFYHTDHKGLTTAGTPQDCDGRWQKAFRVGKDCCVTLAEEAAQICPVDFIVVAGNHDREKVFCLGEVLEARFHKHPQVSVLNSPDCYAYYRWGKVLLGFVHGENYGSKTKRAELPQTMATDRPQDWAETSWREWHLGHFHSETEDVWQYRRVEQVRDMAVRVLPSLSSTDAWHRQAGYASVLAAECHLYHKEKGKYGYLTHCATH